MAGREFKVFRGDRMERSERYDSATGDGIGEALRSAHESALEDPGDEVTRGLLGRIDEIFGKEDEAARGGKAAGGAA
jgi:hypothetical protein